MSQLKSKRIGITGLLKKLWTKLKKRRQVQLKVMIFVMLLSSFAEVISLATVVPFLGILTNPEDVMNMSFFKNFALLFEISNKSEFLFLITLIFVLSAISSGMIRIFNIFLNGRLAAAIGADLSCEAYERTLYQKYETHLQRNSSSLISSMSKEIDRVITLVLNPLLQALTSLMITVGILITLFVINWYAALITSVSIIFVYLIASLANKRPLSKLGAQQVELQKKLIQNVQEGLGSIKDVILNTMQPVHVNIFSKAVNPLKRKEAQAIFLNHYPRLIIEPVGLSLIAILGFILVRNGELEKAIPTLGALALGSMRLLPMAQRLYEGWSYPQNGKASLSNILDLLDQPLNKEELLSNKKIFSFKENILFKNVCFSYSSNSIEVISNLNFEIKKGEKIGIIGETGSGKSTIVDLIMSLIVPTSGQILIDGKDLNETKNSSIIRKWKSSIVHVPQSIYLTDNSIAENIAFGISPKAIDFERLKIAAKQAKIYSFIQSLPNKFQTNIGENGVLLSGGQKQRLGIARALYRDANILILDEATSALDNFTEKSIMDSIDKISDSLTLIMIAHRLSSLKSCDRIFELKGKKLFISS